MTNLKTQGSGILRIFLTVLLTVILVTVIASYSAKLNAAYPGPVGTQPTQGSAVAPTATQAVGSALSQTEIEARAVEYAQTLSYLRGNPTSVASKEMALREFYARLDPFNHDPGRDPSSLVWLVVINGNVVWVNPPTMDGKPSSTEFSNIWVALSPAGDVIGSGARTPGNEIDFNATPKPITSWPTQVKQ